MKVIVVTPAIPHPFGSTVAKWFYVLITGLAGRGHKVLCMTASEESEKLVRDGINKLNVSGGNPGVDVRFFPMKPDLNVLRRKWRNVLRPFGELSYVDGLYDSLQVELKKGYDVLHLEELWTGWLGLGIPRSLLNITHFEIIDWEDKKFNSIGERKKFLQMERATYKIIKKTKSMRVFSTRVLERAKTINPNANYWVLPFALDLSNYPLQPMISEPVVGLLGSMHWEPSRSAAERLLTRIWPLIKKAVPQAKLLVAGWNARKYLGKFMPMPDVTLEENLPHPKEFFSMVSVMVYAPSRGSGPKVKVMESMAYGVPVVTTWEGVEGIDYENGVHCFVAEEDEAIADKVVKLLNDPESRKIMRENARGLLEEKYSAYPVMEKMMRVYEEIQY